MQTHEFENKNNRNSIILAVTKARKLLQADANDIVHGLPHHQAVWDNCRIIIEAEELTGKVDVDALEIAAWWHDINRHKQPVICQETLTRLKLPRDFIAEVVDLIKTHSFAETPETISGDVLWDADKLDYTNIARGKLAIAALKNGAMTKADFIANFLTWQRRISDLRLRFHFETSNIIYRERMREVKNLINNYAADFPEELSQHLSTFFPGGKF